MYGAQCQQLRYDRIPNNGCGHRSLFRVCHSGLDISGTEQKSGADPLDASSFGNAQFAGCCHICDPDRDPVAYRGLLRSICCGRNSVGHSGIRIGAETKGRITGCRSTSQFGAKPDNLVVSDYIALSFRCSLRYGLIYIRGCQEHFSPSAGGADLVRDIQPLSP